MKRTIWLVVVTALALSIVSCRPSVIGTCTDKAKAQKWDENHVDVACYAGIEQKVFLREKDDHTGYVIFYSLLKWPDVVKELQNSIDQLASLRDPSHEEEMEFMRQFNLFHGVLKTEDILKLRLAMANAANVEDMFKGLTGQISPYEDQDKRGGYDPKKIMLPVASDQFSFITPEINEATKTGKLDKIDESFFTRKQKYWEKRPDPANPGDKNSFVWKSRDVGLHLIYYRIKANKDKPDTNVGKYIEGFKVIGGKEEPKPALHIFILTSGLAVALIDSKNDGDPGFGLPDFVEQITLSGLDDIREGSDVWSKLYPKRPEETIGVLPKRPEIVVEISPLDGKPHDVWEEKAKGWQPPSEYRIGPNNENYTIRVEYVKVNGESPKPNDYADIDSVVKVWTTADYSKAAPGEVWEYYRPKPKYAKGVKTVILDAQKKVQFDFVDGSPEVVGTIVPRLNEYIENEPYAIAYTEGKTRYRLEKSPGSSVFDRRKIVSLLKDAQSTLEPLSDADQDISSMSDKQQKKTKQK